MNRARRGFTLVELMVVVAIVGVLAALAIVGFQRYSTSSRSGEAISMLNSLRMAQESFRAENLRYNNCAGAGTISMANYYPMAPAGLVDAKKMWGAPDAAGPNPLPCFNAMGFRASGAVRYSYAVTAGAPGATLGAIDGTSPSTASPNHVGPNPTLTAPVRDPWFVGAAIANLRGPANDGVYSFVWISSQSTEAYVRADSD
jgi:type IV pilus assembly protein PilA